MIPPILIVLILIGTLFLVAFTLDKLIKLSLKYSSEWSTPWWGMPLWITCACLELGAAWVLAMFIANYKA